MINYKKSMKEMMMDLDESRMLKEKLSMELTTAPEGSLQISYKKERMTQYYWYRENMKRKYISKKEMKFIKQLAQKSYNEKVLKYIERRIACTVKLLKEYEYSLDSVYENMSDARKALVTPINLSDKDFIEKWYKENPGGQNPHPFKDELYSNRGEQMRSKSEKILADMFDRLGIPYVYEPKIVFADGRVVYPDFLLLNVSLRKAFVYEHFGMMDAESYCKETIEKIKKYQNIGYYPGENFLFSMETKKDVIDVRSVEKMMKHYIL